MSVAVAGLGNARSWKRGFAWLGVVALTTLGWGCGTQNGNGVMPSEGKVAPAMSAFEAESGEMDAASDAVNSGAAAQGTVGPVTTSNSISLNVEQDATIAATLDLDKTDALGHDRFPYHTGKVNVDATGTVTGNFSDDGSGSLNGSVAYTVDHAVTQDVVYTNGPYSATIANGSTAQHTLNATWAQLGAIHSHTITAHKVLNNVAVSVTGPDGTAGATVSCDVTAQSVSINSTENENSVNGWWQSAFSGGHTVKVTLFIDDKPGTASDVFVVSVIVDGTLVSTNYSPAAFAIRHPGMRLHLLSRFWLAEYIRIDDMFSDGERSWNCWDKVINGVNKDIDNTARANVSGTPLNYQASVSGSVTFPTADAPNLTGTVNYTASGSVSTDGSTFATVNYSASVTAATNLVYSPAPGYSATLGSGATHAWTLNIDVSRTDASNYSVHFDVGGTDTVPSLTVVTPLGTATLSWAITVSGTYDEVAVSGSVTKNFDWQVEWTATASNSDGTITAHRKVELQISA